MVFFSCDGCGEMLKKGHVDGHANRCRRCDSVSCVDCSVSFLGDDYRQHTSCISEAERYEGKLFKQNKKRNPQEEWMSLVEECTSRAPPHLKSYMQTICGLDNVPRKEKQFRNFTANSLKLRGQAEKIVGEIWKILKAERDKRQTAREAQQKKDREAQAEKKREEEEKAAKKKPPSVSDDEEANTKIDPKTVHKAMKKVLKKAPNKSMKLKELRKVLGEKLGVSKKAKKQLKRILKEIPEASKKKIKVDGKIVTLL